MHYLGIAAGLQDRVIQTYGGLVFMDFTPFPSGSSSSTTLGNEYKQYSNDPIVSTHGLLVEESSRHNRYISLNPKLAPVLYLAYNLSAGNIYFYVIMFIICIIQYM